MGPSVSFLFPLLHLRVFLFLLLFILKLHPFLFILKNER